MSGRVVPLSTDLSLESRRPRFDEGLHRRVPPPGVRDERDRHSVLNVVGPFAEREVETTVRSLSGTSLCPALKDCARFTSRAPGAIYRGYGVGGVWCLPRTGEATHPHA